MFHGFVCQVEESASRTLSEFMFSFAKVLVRTAVSCFCLPRCWTCEATALSAVSWKEGGERGNFKRRKRRERGVMAKLFISFLAIFPGSRIHASPRAWLAGSEQPRRLKDKKQPHF